MLTYDDIDIANYYTQRMLMDFFSFNKKMIDELVEAPLLVENSDYPNRPVKLWRKSYIDSYMETPKFKADVEVHLARCRKRKTNKLKKALMQAEERKVPAIFSASEENLNKCEENTVQANQTHEGPRIDPKTFKVILFD